MKKMIFNKFPTLFFEKHCYSLGTLGNEVQNIPVFAKSLQRRGIYTLDPIDPNEPTFSKILIANRGEIACRIINTARKMGIKTVAVYSIADAQSRHTKLADEAVFIGPARAAQSYLNMNKILDAIKSTGAEAVHPGYGFLSENATFASQLDEANIVFIGPSPKAIIGMGDKLKSKRLARAAGVNTIPGYDGIVKNAEHCVEISQKIGYPVMIKASAGGGGKGIRIARNGNEVREGFKLSTEEAANSFSDSRILVEKFIENPRHIEIQVLGDKYGNIIHLNERECSIQRRNQKVIEEAPSVLLDPDTRKAMGEQAVSLCKKLDYYSAGTVEFLVDEQRNFYFLEMNTRLQVEHPITEHITGVDLVHQMIRIAKGYPLKISQKDVKINGWAIESRIYAEDSYKNFGMPNVGRLHKYIEPNHISGVRCDSGVEEGSEISLHYDPMISKLICYGKDRQEAIDKSVEALDHYVIRGVTHNIPLLRDILTETRFKSGSINTNYLPEVYPNGFKGHKLTEDEKTTLFITASAFYAANELRNRCFLNGPQSYYCKTNDAWNIVITLNERNYSLHVSQVDKSFEINFNNKIFRVSKNDINLASPTTVIGINNEHVVVQSISRNPNGEYKIIYLGTTYHLNVISKQAADFLQLIVSRKPKIDVSKIIKSPMPGLVKSISCQVGDVIMEGQELCTIEAMKMQNAMVALASGTIKTVKIKEGDTVSNDDVLIELE